MCARAGSIRPAWGPVVVVVVVVGRALGEEFLSCDFGYLVLAGP